MMDAHHAAPLVLGRFLEQAAARSAGGYVLLRRSGRGWAVNVRTAGGDRRTSGATPLDAITRALRVLLGAQALAAPEAPDAAVGEVPE